MSAAEEDPPPAAPLQSITSAEHEEQDVISPPMLGSTLEQLLEEQARGAVKVLDLVGHVALLASFAARDGAPPEYVGERPGLIAPEVMAMVGAALLGRAGWEHARAANDTYAKEVQERDKEIRRIASERFPDPATDAGVIADSLLADPALATLLTVRTKDDARRPILREPPRKIIGEGRK